MKAGEWIRSLERAFKMIRCLEAQRATFASCSTNGEAQIWWESAEQMYEAEGRQVSWEDFKREFIDLYLLSMPKDRKASKFLHLRQGKKTVADYETKFRERTRYAPHQVANETVKSKKFQDGLAPLL